MGVAESRFRRVATVALAVWMISTGLPDLWAIIAQSDYLAAWWWYPTIVLNVGAAVSYLILPIFSARGLRTVSTVYAAGTLAGLVAIPFAGELPDDLGLVWTLRMMTAFALAAALAFPVRQAWAFIGLLFLVEFIDLWSGDLATATASVLVSISVATPFVLIVQALLRAGRVLDAAAASAIAAARRDAAGLAAALERRRVELLAHDEILYTLRATALGFPTAELARRSLDQLAQVESAADSTGDLLTRLRSITTQLAPHGTFSVEGTGDLPADVADALVEAAGEALRNSVLHGRGAAIRVSGELSARRAVVMVSDDGPGFRAARLAAGRLGVAHSILERMQSIEGGSARLMSAPGRGTSVELGWAA